MGDILGALAFAALIGAQFLAVIVVSSDKAAIYADPHDPVGGEPAHSREPGRDAVDGALRPHYGLGFSPPGAPAPPIAWRRVHA